MSSVRRRKEIAELNEEGRQAALAGRSRQSYPQKYNGTMDVHQWLVGYDAGAREKMQSEVDDDPELEKWLDLYRKAQKIGAI